jgi:hypothetical protein
MLFKYEITNTATTTESVFTGELVELSEDEMREIVGGIQVETYGSIGGSVNLFSNSANSGSSVVGGFVTQGVLGSSYTNNQVSSGGSSTQTQSSFSNSANTGSSWYIPASTGYGF